MKHQLKLHKCIACNIFFVCIIQFFYFYKSKTNSSCVPYEFKSLKPTVTDCKYKQMQPAANNVHLNHYPLIRKVCFPFPLRPTPVFGYTRLIALSPVSKRAGRGARFAEPFISPLTSFSGAVYEALAVLREFMAVLNITTCVGVRRWQSECKCFQL